VATGSVRGPDHELPVTADEVRVLADELRLLANELPSFLMGLGE
jgi:hypothetical protein